MEKTITEHAHIAFNEKTSEPIIKNTRISVRDIAELWLQGAQPEEILLHYPHLTLAQIFDALSYYDDHREVIDEYIKKNAVPGNVSGTRLSR